MLKWTALSSLMILLSGCSMEASIESLTKDSPIKMQEPAKPIGLVSGSTQMGTATGGGVTYHVQSSAGGYTSGIEQKTSDNSYKIYSSVQGALVSK